MSRKRFMEYRRLLADAENERERAFIGEKIGRDLDLTKKEREALWSMEPAEPGLWPDER